MLIAPQTWQTVDERDMQSVYHGWRALSRAILSGIHNEFQLKTRPKVKGPVQFVTGCSGFSKSLTKPHNFKNWSFGDDAYFVARNTSYDVIGKSECRPLCYCARSNM